MKKPALLTNADRIEITFDTHEPAEVRTRKWKVTVAAMPIVAIDGAPVLPITETWFWYSPKQNRWRPAAQSLGHARWVEEHRDEIDASEIGRQILQAKANLCDMVRTARTRHPRPGGQYELLVWMDAEEVTTDA